MYSGCHFVATVLGQTLCSVRAQFRANCAALHWLKTECIKISRSEFTLTDSVVSRRNCFSQFVCFYVLELCKIANCVIFFSSIYR